MHDAADAVIHALHHRRVDRLILNLAILAVAFRPEFRAGCCRSGREFAPVFLDQRRLRLLRVVHGVVRKIEEERPIFRPLDELQRLVRQSVGQVFLLGSVGQPGQIVGRKIGRRRSAMVAGDVKFKTLILRQVAFAAEMPFTDEGRNVSALLERFRQRHLFERKVIRQRGPVEFLLRVIGPARQPVRDPEARGIFARHNARARRRADVARGIRAGEPHPLRRQPVEVRRLVERTPVTREIRPAQIVHQDEDHVGAALGRRNRRAKNGEGKGEAMDESRHG